jgi:hypothetical protein
MKWKCCQRKSLKWNWSTDLISPTMYHFFNERRSDSKFVKVGHNSNNLSHDRSHNCLSNLWCKRMKKTDRQSELCPFRRKLYSNERDVELFKRWSLTSLLCDHFSWAHSAVPFRSLDLWAVLTFKLRWATLTLVASRVYRSLLMILLLRDCNDWILENDVEPFGDIPWGLSSKFSDLKEDKILHSLSP